MNGLRLVFMGTPAFALPALEALAKGPWQLVAAVTQPDRPRGRGRQPAAPPVKEAARAMGVPVLQPADLREGEARAELAALRPDLIVTAAFGQILPPAVLDIPPLGCLNLHASLLPRYRGAAPIQRAVMDGERVTGVTTMYMARGLDTGDVILQAATSIGARETAGELEERLATLGARLLYETVSLVAEGRAPRRPQENALATWAPPLRREEERIAWERPAGRIVGLVRGLNPQPGAYTTWGEKRFKVWRAEEREAPGGAEPGTVLEVLPGAGFLVQAGRGAVLVQQVQPAGKKTMAAADFVLGYRLQAGDRLGGEADAG